MLSSDDRRDRLTHSDLAATVYFEGRTLAYRDKRLRGWRMLPTGDETMDRATNHAISGNPDDISAGDLRRAIADKIE